MALNEERSDRPFLAIDTSTALGSVAVGRGDRLLAEIIVGVTVRHSEALLPAIDYLLGSAGLEPSDLGGIVVGGGPGSFTGVRVAGATAKGLVRVLGTPLFAYSGLLALAAGAGPTSARPVCALFDARRAEVYAAAYQFNGREIETLLEPTVEPLAEVIERLRESNPVYLGDGAIRYRSEIEAAGAEVGPAFMAAPRGGALLWLADTVPELGLVPEPAAWEPAYLRGAGVGRGVAG